MNAKAAPASARNARRCSVLLEAGDVGHHPDIACHRAGSVTLGLDPALNPQDRRPPVYETDIPA